MQDHTITISAKDVQERNMRVRDLLSRGYMPIKFYVKEDVSKGATNNRYRDSHGKMQRIHETSHKSFYCAVMRRAGERRAQKAVE